MFHHPDFDGHEQVVVVHDPGAGLRAIIALHSTALGPAFGGCRMWPYGSAAEALTDVLRLACGMTYKAAICGLPYGGGKSVIIGDPARDKTPALLRAMGRAVERLAGRYVVADDIGTTLEDIAVMREVTGHTAAATPAAREPLAVTAYGVYVAIRAAVRHVTGRDGLAGLRVAIQGLGNVGRPLAGYLHEAGAELTVADLNPARAAGAVQDLGARAVAPDAIYHQPVDLFAPCALGAVLDDRTIPRLKARIVCGGANNQLALPRHAAALAARGILYVPDYLANAGGVIDFHQERIDDSRAAVLAAVGRIEGITAEILRKAEASGRSPHQIADQRVKARLAAARRTRRAA
ncbi:MAG TPA: Glu/Leu/Phe/Val dehydrogenase dimerization domain-containing protein [Geminicoccaceae bacterium]|nr:Glu/Leu/Phe/Val dehydrogenase dimerization domain-containing protein [Geminicoccaceae bacterium]